MKKNIFVIIIFALLSGLCLSACNSPSSISGSFNKDEYSIAIDEVIDIYDDFSVQGVEKSEVFFSSSNEKLLQSFGENKFKALASGQAYILAKYQNKVISSTKIYIGYQLSEPSNITIDENGLLSWDESFAVLDGNRIDATSYQLAYAHKTQNNNLQFTIQSLTTNSFTFQEKDVYVVKIKAISSDSRIASSKEIEKEINYGTMGNLEDVTLTTSEQFGNQQATLTWKEKPQGIYDIYLQGFLVQENIGLSYFTYDFSSFAGGEEIELEIVAKDSTKSLMSTSTIIKLNKLNEPNLHYVYNGDGKLQWSNDVNCIKYWLRVTDSQLNENICEITDRADLNLILSGFAEGIYDVDLFSQGGENESGLYINSDLSSVKVGKLKTVTPQIEFKDNRVFLTFDNDDYIQNYKITIDFQSIDYNTSNGLTTSIDISSLSVGNHILKVTALPTADSDSESGVKEIVYNQTASKYVLNSDDFIFDFVVLEEIGDMTHSLVGTQSTLRFSVDSKVNKIEFYINDTLFEDAEILNNNGIVTIYFNNLENFQPDNDGYNLKVLCYYINGESGQEYAMHKEKIKRLEILDVVTKAQEQENGYFKWQALAEDCEYFYQIFKTESDYQIVDEAIYFDTTSALKTSANLDEGYYVIKITSISKDTNLYLSSNFYDENNIFVSNFIVTKDIQSPTITFFERENNKIVNIATTEHGGEYQIYVDGQLDGNIVLSENKSSIEYTLSDELTEEGKHTIEVKALCGLLNDGTIYLPSQNATLYVNRLKTPEFEVREVFDAFGGKTNQLIIVKTQSNSSGATFIFNGTTTTSENYQLDIKDRTVYGDEFDIIMIVNKGSSQGNNYYIDSHEKSVHFKRVQAPTGIKFSDGTLSWTNDDQLVEKYYISLTIVNSLSTNYYKYFYTENNAKTFNLQAFIDNLNRTDTTFASAFRSGEKVQIEISAYKLGLVDDNFILPSNNGTTTLGLDKLDIETLQTPTLSFEKSTLTISWNGEFESEIYDIYVDNSLKIEGYDKTSLNLSQLGVDFTEQKEIYLQAREQSHFNSECSQSIFIKQLIAPNSLNITKENSSFSGSINFVSDISYIEKVLLNDDDSKVNFTQGSSSAGFSFDDFSDVKEFSIKLISKEGSGNHYYIDSEVSTWTIENLVDYPITLQLTETSLEWNLIATDVSGANINAIRYIVAIENGENSYTLTFEDENSLLLSEIEEKLSIKLEGLLKVNVTAEVLQDYILSNASSQAKGYIGKSQSNEVTFSKLASVANINVEVIDSTSSQTLIEQKVNASLKISFPDLWSDFDEVTFIVKVPSGDSETTLELSSNGSVNLFYTFRKVDSEYQLILNKYLLSMLGAGNINCNIQVTRLRSISSEKTTLLLSKFSSVRGGNVSEDGVLTITDKQVGASYVVEIDIEDAQLEKTLLLSDGEKSINILTEDLIGNRKGYFTVKLLAFDENKKIIPSSEAVTIDGYRLEDIESIYINDHGEIVITLYPDDLSDIVFTAKNEDILKIFTPLVNDDNDYQYTISMFEMLKLFKDGLSLTEGEYSFDIAVKKEGSINSNWKNIKFNYGVDNEPQLTRGRDYDKDYIIFELLEGDVESVTFVTTMNATFISEDEEGNQVFEDKEIIYYNSSSTLQGYWVTDLEGNNGYFVTEKGSETDLVYKECYAISVNEMLKDLQYGSATFNVYRIGKLGDRYYQFNDTNFEVYKLNKINDNIGDEGALLVKNNILSFTWTCQDANAKAGTKPTGYYILFENENGEITRKELIFVYSLDLRTIDLVAGVNYKIYVEAISSERTIIASNYSQSVTALQYTRPLALEVNDGIITFNKDGFKNSAFMQDIIDFFNQNTTELYHDTVGTKQYTIPYYFSPSLLPDLKVTLKFSKIEGGGTTNTCYMITLPAYWLFPEIYIDFTLESYRLEGESFNNSYLVLLQRYANKNLSDNNDTIQSINTKLMIDALANCPCGIADNAILIDDIARAIPAGEYMISLIQTTNAQYVESIESEGVKIYISPSPEVNLDTRNVNGKTQYIANVVPATTMINDGNGNYTKENALKYKLQLRPTEEIGTYYIYGNIELIITYENSEWVIRYGDVDLVGVIETTSTLYNGIPSFIINMNELRTAVNDCAGTEIISCNTLMRADIFVYYQDDGYVVNGKSGVFNLRYLDLQEDAIHFVDGKFVVDNVDYSNEILVKYKKASQTLSSFTVKFLNGKAEIDLSQTGSYEYIILSLNGSISANTMNVESETYAIKDLYKLNQPTLSTSNNNLMIYYNSTDKNYMNTLAFNLANNITLNESYTGDDKGYYCHSNITSTTSAVPYYVGNTPTELNANEFYVYLSGNSGKFTKSDEIFEMADVVLTFTEEDAVSSSTTGRPVLSSKTASIKARVLDSVNSYSINQGHIAFIDNNEGEEIVTNESGDSQSANLIYEIIIEYYVYVEDNDNPGYLCVATETYYSERNLLDNLQIFDTLNFNSYYNYFNAQITILAGLKSDESVTDSIQTIEGSYFRLSQPVYFSEDNCQVLRSQSYKNSFIFGRTKAPYLAEEGSIGVLNGDITFAIDKESVYFADAIGSEGIDNDTAKRISIYAVYTQGGQTYKRLLTGKYSFVVDSAKGIDVYVNFTPDEGQLNDIIGAFNILVYVYGNGTILSNSLAINTVYKLPKIEQKYYDIKLDINGNTIIDLSSYFNNVSISDDKNCYKLVLSYTSGDGRTINETFTSSNVIKSLILPEDINSLSIQAKDNQTTSEINRKKLLYSDITLLNINETNIEGLKLSWNSQEMRFEWSWADGRTDNYEYYVDIYVSGVHKTCVTQNNFYMPEDRGIISTNGFSIRARKIDNENPENVYSFSNDIVYSGDPVEFKLFAGGNGSQASPYLIASDIDFLNISKRNASDFYFKLSNNIEIDISQLILEGEQLLMKDFYAHLDGNSYKITITISKFISLDPAYKVTLIGKQDLSFSYFASLFYQLSPSASVKNLFIDYIINLSGLKGESVMLSPLCAFNYGTIENVKVTSLTVSRISGSGDGNNIFVGGISGVNYGRIANCVNNASFDYTMAQQLNLNFGYAGITLFNANITTYVGNISNCFNQGAKNVTVTVNNNLVYMAGITLTNSGKISLCGNDGDLTMQARSVTTLTGYYGGICITSSNATLEYLYSNGKIANNSTYGIFNYGGITYQITGGSINNLIVTVDGQPIVKNCTTKPSDKGSNYASISSGTSTNIVVKELSDVTIETTSGYKLIISSENGTYKASISL